jgi:hypothetical protein
LVSILGFGDDMFFHLPIAPLYPFGWQVEAWGDSMSQQCQAWNCWGTGESGCVFFLQPEGDFHGEPMENPHENEHVLLGRVWIIELTIERACMSVKILDASCDGAVLQELRTWVQGRQSSERDHSNLYPPILPIMQHLGSLQLAIFLDMTWAMSQISPLSPTTTAQRMGHCSKTILWSPHPDPDPSPKNG